METATTRTIRIGSASIGLIGLDIALNRAAAKEMKEDEAVDFLFREISRRNYVPTGAEAKYRAALRQTYRSHLGLEPDQTGSLIIRIFGTGCVSCNNIQVQVIEVLDKMQMAADIEQIHDPDEIGRQGIIMTPALMINGVVKSGGKPPTVSQIEQWIREAAHG